MINFHCDIVLFDVKSYTSNASRMLTRIHTEPVTFLILHIVYGTFFYVIASLSDLPMFYTNYLTMYKVHMYACAIRKLVYGCVYAREIIHSLKLVSYLPVILTTIK